MGLQLVIVIALVALSAAYLGYRLFGSLGSTAKTPAGCAGCCARPSCASLESDRRATGRQDPLCPADPPALRTTAEQLPRATL